MTPTRRRRTIRARRLLDAKRDTSLLQVVRAHFHFDAITGGEPDEVLPEFAGNMRQHDMAVREFDSEHGTRQHGNDLAFDFDGAA